MSRTPLSFGRLPDDQPVGKPKNMLDSECGTLYVRVEPYEHNPTLANLVSRWLLTDQQRQQIAEGTHEILLGSVGGQMPVMLYVSDEFNKIDPTNGEPIDFRRFNPPYGWIYCGPDGECHWSEKYDTHESATNHRPATYLERWFFIHAGPPSEFGEASFKAGLITPVSSSEDQIAHGEMTDLLDKEPLA